MTDRYNYLAKNHELLVIEKISGKLAWNRKPYGIEVELVIPVPSSDYCIDLLLSVRSFFDEILEMG
jgi:hypothetical protein